MHRATPAQNPMPDAVSPAAEHSALASLCWVTAAILLAFPCFAQLGVLVSFCAGRPVSAFVAPVALVAALAVGDLLARREGLCAWRRGTPPALALATLTAAALFAASLFDMSWDGLWYHQTAVYQMAHGWNPLHDPLHAFMPSVQDSLRFYAKGPWYFALSLYQLTPHIEWVKPAPLLALAAMFLAVAAALLDFGMRRTRAALLAALVSLNPVVLCQIVSYLVDGLMISYLACYVAAVARGLRRRGLLTHFVAASAAMLCINTKISGLVYLCFFSAAGGLYLLLCQRRLLLGWAALQMAWIALGCAVMGFNPYITNTIHRGHPFYPWMGNAAFPGYTQQGKDPVDRWETPHNMLGHNRLFRFSYAIFGRPGAQPFYQGTDAHLMWPFDVRWRDFAIFYFHEVRIGGFGPLFSGAFVIAVCLLGAALIRPGMPRVVVLLLAGTVVASLLVGLHMWWARYGPQLWWLPIIAVLATLAVPDWRAVRWAGWTLAALLLVNAILVGGVHLGWEIYATRTTHQQLELLRGKGEIEVDLQYFVEPYGERLRAGGVAFRPSRRLHCAQPLELMSVTPGYPGTVRACVPEN